MPSVTFITQYGERITVDNAEGDLMSIALREGIDGIQGDCGGSCSCGTCLVHVSEEWVARTGPATDDEHEILDYEENVTATSRLSCQIKLTEELDGLVVTVANK